MRHRIAAGIVAVVLLGACSPATGEDAPVGTTAPAHPATTEPGSTDSTGSTLAEVPTEETEQVVESTTTTMPDESPDLDEELNELESELGDLLDELDDLLADL
jgi:hypothetical protein